MGASFGALLKGFRDRAKLSQEQLAQKASEPAGFSISGSQISRYEHDRVLRMGPEVIRSFITTLSRSGIPLEELSKLWHAAGYQRSPIQLDSEVDALIDYIRQVFQGADPALSKMLRDDIESTIVEDLALDAGITARKQRLWRHAEENVKEQNQRRHERNRTRDQLCDEEHGRIAYGLGNYQVAAQYFESALWAARRAEDEHQQGVNLLLLGNTRRRIGSPGDWARAREHYDKAREIFERLGDSVQEASCRRKSASMYLFQGRPGDVVKHFDALIQECRTADDPQGLYKALQHKAWAIRMLGQWEEAVQLCQEALSIVQETTTDQWERAKAYRYLGDACRVNGDVDAAEKAYYSSLYIAEQLIESGIEAQVMAAMANLGLAKVSARRKREHEAIAFLNDSFDPHLVRGEAYRIAQIQIEQGDVLKELGRHEEAEARLLQARDSLEASGAVYDYALALLSLCELYFECRRHPEVFESAQAARESDNGWINYQLAMIELTVAKALIAEGKNSRQEIAAAFDRAIAFNSRTVRKVQQELLASVDRLAKSTPQLATLLCRSVVDVLQDLDDSLVNRPPLQEALGSFRLKQTELEALIPINNQNAAH